MQLRAISRDHDGTIAKDGVLDPAVRTAIANDRSTYKFKLERWKNEDGNSPTTGGPISITRDAQEFNDELKKRRPRSN